MRNITMLAAAALALAGCGGKSGDADDDGAVNTTIHGPNGDVTLSSATMPKNLPDYAAAYPGATPADSVLTPDGGGILTLRTPDAPAKVLSYYEQLEQAKGLTNKMDTGADAGGTRTINYNQPGTKRALTLGVGPADDGKGTSISLAYN